MMNGDRPAKQFASWWARDIICDPRCQLPARARSLLMLLASFTNAAYYCEPSVAALARGIGCSESSVHRGRRELVAAGLVRIFAGTGRGHTNGYWLAVRGMPPPARKGVTHDTVSLSTRVSPVTAFQAVQGGRVIHKGVTGDTERVSPVTPEVDNEVSRERARVSSPPLPADVAKAFRDEDEMWGYR